MAKIQFTAEDVVQLLILGLSAALISPIISWLVFEDLRTLHIALVFFSLVVLGSIVQGPIGTRVD